MLRKTKVMGIVVGLFLALVLGLVWSQYGEYDTRDLPNKIRIFKKGVDNFHVHAEALYAPQRKAYYPCAGIFGTGLIEKNISYADVPITGKDVQIKQKWAGICKYEFSLLSITCTKNKTSPSVSNETYESALITNSISSVTSSDSQGSFEKGSSNKIVNHYLSIVGDSLSKRFYGCDHGCEEQNDFGISSSDSVLYVSCMESSDL